MNKVFGYHIKGLKTMEGHEGLIMRGTIMSGRTAVADFFNDGNGGMTDFDILVPNDVFMDMDKQLTAQYEKIGVMKPDAESSLGWTSAWDFLIDDIMYINDLKKSAKSHAKKKGWDGGYVSVFSHKDERLGFLLGGMYSKTPCRDGRAVGYGSESFYLGSFSIGTDINITGEVAC